MSYDTKCYELAEYFTDDQVMDEEDVSDLAQQIQDTIEDWLQEKAIARLEANIDRDFEGYAEQ